MFFLLGAVFMAISFFAVRRDRASAKWARGLFYFGLFLVALGVILVGILFYSKHSH